MNTTATQRDSAKQALFAALKNHNGDTKNELVVAAIEKLASLNPNSAPTENGSLLEGNWLLINAPNFPGRQEDDRGRCIYTLGRLAFNMFEPVELLVEIERVLQPVFPNVQMRTHRILTHTWHNQGIEETKSLKTSLR